MRTTRRTRWTSAGLALLVAGGAALAGSLPADAQEAPTLTVSPTGDLAPGTELTLTVEGCPVGLELTVAEQFSDALFTILPDPTDPLDPWTGQLTASETDLRVTARCDGAESDVVVDVEHPILSRGGLVSPDSTWLYGTDCPEPVGADTPRVFVDGVEVDVAIDGPDDLGDFSTDLAAVLPTGATATVTAECGTVTYEAIEMTGPVGTTTTSTTSTSTTTTSPSTSSTSTTAPSNGTHTPRATPVTTRARFTG